MGEHWKVSRTLLSRSRKKEDESVASAIDDMSLGNVQHIRKYATSVRRKITSRFVVN